MSFLAPAALALGLLAVPIILLYMLRLRRREHPISSTYLWKELVRDRSANAPWQRLRRNLLLLLQLLILALLVLALARPFLRGRGPVGGNLIVLLDASASMTATDGADGRARFDQAVDEVRRIVDGLSGDDRLSLLTAGRAPVVLGAATNDRQLLRRVLDSAAAENGPADWNAAIALAGAAAQGLSDPRFVVITDGGLPESLPALPGDVSLIPIGRSGDNLTIAALAARPSGDRSDLLVRVTNNGPTLGRALLSLYVDDTLHDARQVEIAPGDDATLTWALPAGAGTIAARLEPEEGTADYLLLDDSAWSVLDGQGEHRVLLVSEGNLFLERLFAVLPGYELVRADPTDDLSALGETGAFDLLVFDGVALPDPLPPGNMLIFDPQQPAEDGQTDSPIQATGTFTNTAVTLVADDPLLADVDWRSVAVSEAQTVEAAGLRALVEAEGGPLLLAGEVDGHRIILLPFDLRASDLPLQIAFPVIMANITAWLDPGGAGVAETNVELGETVSLTPPPRAEAILVELPDGSVWSRALQGATGPITFADTHLPGLYSVSYRDPAGETTPAGVFAVNFNDADESRIQPNDTIQLGQTDVTPTSAGGRQELWAGLLLIGLAILLLEWWISYRRSRPRPGGLGKTLK